MKRAAGLLLGVMLQLFPGWALAEGLPRLASLSVCADQFLLALAEPGQIAALSAQAHDPALSFLIDEARRYPTTQGRAEEILALSPEIVLSDDYANAATLRLLKQVGITMIVLPNANSFAGIEQTLRDIGRAIGRPEAGEAAARHLAARRAQLAATRPAKTARTLYLLPTGATAGPGTYVNEVLQLAGFTNDAIRRGIKGWRRLSLEELMLDPPPHVIMSFLDRNANAVGMSFGTNPVRRRIPALHAPITVPNELWPCAGPMLIEAAEYLRARLPG